jgi:adenine phosphoribosyltransferase
MSKDLDLKQHIRSIPDFPKPGILFYDISTLLAHPKAWHTAIERLADLIRPHKPDVLAGIESRGFLLAAPLALALGTGFVMMRKQGKLPGTTVRHTYSLEYGTDTIEIQQDAVHKGSRVVLVDDLLATGGTMDAAVNLLETVGAVVPATAVLIELTVLEGRKRLTPPVETLLQYDS